MALSSHDIGSKVVLGRHLSGFRSKTLTSGGKRGCRRTWFCGIRISIFTNHQPDTGMEAKRIPETSEYKKTKIFLIKCSTKGMQKSVWSVKERPQFCHTIIFIIKNSLCTFDFIYSNSYKDQMHNYSTQLAILKAIKTKAKW